MLQSRLLKMRGFDVAELLWRKDTAWNKSVCQAIKHPSASALTLQCCHRKRSWLSSARLGAESRGCLSASTPPFPVKDSHDRIMIPGHALSHFCPCLPLFCALYFHTACLLATQSCCWGEKKRFPLSSSGFGGISVSFWPCFAAFLSQKQLALSSKDFSILPGRPAGHGQQHTHMPALPLFTRTDHGPLQQHPCNLQAAPGGGTLIITILPLN